MNASQRVEALAGLSKPTVETLKPSTVLRRVKAGTLADPQPRGTGRITCHEHGHAIAGDTESPTYWENGDYVYCPTCKATKLAHVTFAGFAIDLSGERKKYPMTLTGSLLDRC